MNQPPFEVADMVRAAGKGFIEKNRSPLSWQHLRVLRAMSAAAQRRWGPMWISVLAAAIRPSPITHVVTALVVRSTRSTGERTLRRDVRCSERCRAETTRYDPVDGIAAWHPPCSCGPVRILPKRHSDDHPLART